MGCFPANAGADVFIILQSTKLFSELSWLYSVFEVGDQPLVFRL